MIVTVTGLTITLPLPPAALSPNARLHWSKRASAVSRYRSLAWGEAKLATWNGSNYRAPRWERAEVRAVFYFATRRTRDMDNLQASLKSALDGLADAGIVANDCGFVPAPPEMRIDKLNPRVEIRVTGLTTGAGAPLQEEQ